MLLPFAGPIADADARLAPRIDRGDAGRDRGARSPTTGSQPEDGLPRPDAHGAAYVDYLLARLEAPRAFVEEADRARAA